MGNFNKVLLIGRLGQDVEKRVTPSGNSVVNVTLATSEYFKDKEGNKQEKTEWHQLVAWNAQAEVLERFCKKGSQIHIEGSLTTSEWIDKEENKRQTTKINVRNIQLLDPKGQTGNNNNSQPSQNNVSQNNAKQEEFVEDDIPF